MTDPISEPAQKPPDVRRRKVFYIPGYDPFPPRRYRELYRKEAARQAEISGYAIALHPGGADGRYGWRASALVDGVRVEAEFEVLIWSDIVRRSMAGGIATTYWQALRTSWLYVTSGALRRLAMLRKGPVIAALYPIVVLLAQLALALLAGHLAGWAAASLARAGALLVAGEGAAARWAAALGYWPVFLALAVVVLRLFKALDQRIYAHYLMHDYAFSASERGATPAALKPRIEDFTRAIRDALQGPVDEVLVVGHSSGAHIAVEALAPLLRDGAVPEGGPCLSLLSLGQVIPMVSFLPDAWSLRADLRTLSESDALVWVDVSAPGDGCAFALCDPVSVSGVATDEKRWPLVFSAQFTRALSPARWRALRWRFFRLHFQYLCAFDHPRDYDYFLVTAGPLSLGRRYADRPASPSRIDIPVSPHRGVVAP